MSDELKVIEVFLTDIDAELAQTALEAAGIESMIRVDDLGGMRPHMQMSNGVQLLVREEDVDRALEVLGTEPVSAEDGEEREP